MKIRFSPAQLESMRLRNGAFSLTRFKWTFRDTVAQMLVAEYRFNHHKTADVTVTRVALRDLNRDHPANFRVDVEISVPGLGSWSQSYSFVFTDPKKGLEGDFVPSGRRRFK